jgi:hypothetical protein
MLVELQANIFPIGPPHTNFRRWMMPTLTSLGSCLHYQCSYRLATISSVRPTFSFRDNPSFSPASHWSPLAQEPPSPQESRKPPSKRSCRRAKPSFNKDQGKWCCSVCKDAFRNRYECERHIENVGKQAVCRACGKTVCARKDNQKRHYNQYCKRMDQGKNGGLALEDAFLDVYQ